MGSLLSIISRVFNTLCNVFKRNSIAVESSHCNQCNAKTCVDNDNALRNSVNTSERDFAVNKEKRIGSKVTNRKPTMDVTKHNFLEVLDLIDSVIAECDFIAIDTELTGLKRSDVKTLQVFGHYRRQIRETAGPDLMLQSDSVRSLLFQSGR